MNALIRCIFALSLLTVTACMTPGSVITGKHAAVTAPASAERVHTDDTAVINP